MTPEERLDLIDRLARANDASRDEIARRRAELENDPCGFDLVKLADRRATGIDSDLAYTDSTETPVGSPHMRRTNSRGIDLPAERRRAISARPAARPGAFQCGWSIRRRT